MEQLINSNITAIRIDRYGFNFHININFGYNYKGLPDYRHLTGNGKNISLISAIDRQKIIGSMFFEGSVNLKIFAIFYPS